MTEITRAEQRAALESMQDYVQAQINATLEHADKDGYVAISAQTVADTLSRLANMLTNVAYDLWDAQDTISDLRAQIESLDVDGTDHYYEDD